MKHNLFSFLIKLLLFFLLEKTINTQPEQNQPEQNQPDPNQPEPSQPEPNQLDPNQPESNQPDPNHPESAQPEPVETEPVHEIIQCILDSEASQASDCLKNTTNDTYCCYISPLEDNTKPSVCYPFLKSKYFGYLNINYDKKLYSINCGIGSTFMDSDWDLTLDDKSVCGTMYPKDYKDCIKASSEDNSCCFYEGENMKGCYWLGIKYQGKVTKKKYSFVCEQSYINVFIFFLLFLLVLNLF